MAHANTSSEIQIYNKEVQNTPFIKIMIPASAVTAATLAGTLTYATTNASVSALSTATEMGINGVGFIVGKTVGVLVSPLIGTSISIGSGFVATAAKEKIQIKGKLLSIATGSVAGAVAGAGTAIAVTAGSYLFSGLLSLGEAVSNTLHTWARASQYTDTGSQLTQPIWGMNREDEIKTPTQEIEVLDEELMLSSPSSEETNAFMKQVEQVVNSIDLAQDK